LEKVKNDFGIFKSLFSYRQIIDTVLSEVFSKMTETVIHPSEVSKVVVDAVTADNPEFRYVAGKDAIRIMDAKKTFRKII
jgi:hypothetical protein